MGKDSAVMLHIAKKAFYPFLPPFPLLHIDTTWKFKDMYQMRNKTLKDKDIELIIYMNPEAKKLSINPFYHGKLHTDMWKTEGLKMALDKYSFDIAFGGARMDEEKSRSKERICSFRTKDHIWDPRNQRPELWNYYNLMKSKGESIRVFPLSNWTELDIWQYLKQEDIDIVPLYFSSDRPTVIRDGQIIMIDDNRFPLNDGEKPLIRSIRFRTLGCYPLTGAILSKASTFSEIIKETLLSNSTERQGRIIDQDKSSSMEIKKQKGYF